MISEAEVLAGLDFLERHAPGRMKEAVAVAHRACLVIREDTKIDELRARPANDLELSVRSANALAHLGLKTVRAVEEFAWLPDAVILERGKKLYFGKKCVKEVRECLTNIGLGRRNGAPA